MELDWGDSKEKEVVKEAIKDSSEIERFTVRSQPLPRT
jgi:hypothetical protein